MRATMLTASRATLAPLSRACGQAPVRVLSTAQGDIELLQKLLQQAKVREKEEAKALAALEAGEGGGEKFHVQCFNAISSAGLKKFSPKEFAITVAATPECEKAGDPHAVLFRSHKLQTEEVSDTVRAIARCGAGTNNIPIDAMTARGIPVFNTPGANANAVKELVVCGMLLAARGVVEGIQHVKEVIVKAESGHAAINKRVEKDKKHFGGVELVGKTLAVCGLGNIGAMVAEVALSLGMEVVGYDPKISVEAAWRLSSSVKKANSLQDAIAAADFVSINMPYIKGVTHHALNEEVLSHMKPTCHILNFARAEIIDGTALQRMYKAGHVGKYICDFPDEHMMDHPKFICIPHLGASTEEAEDNCARMAAEQIIDFLETGTIRNSVNFPATTIERPGEGLARICVINKNVPGVLGEITTFFGSKGLNITQQINTSRDSIAYNVIDLDNELSDADADHIQDELNKLDAVISSRLIWTGSVDEGPRNFVVKKA